MSTLLRRCPTLLVVAAVLAVVTSTGCSRDSKSDKVKWRVDSSPIVPALSVVGTDSGFDFTSAPRQDAVGYGQGAAVADIDGDGDLDIFLPQDGAPCALFRNDGRWLFTEVAGPAGVQVDGVEAHAKSAAFVDFDRDGDADLFVGTAGEGNRLYRNRGDGTFDDVSIASGIGAGSDFTVSAAVGDFDGDGWPDLYLCNFAITDYDDPLALQETPAPNRLMRNNGDGTFADVAAACGVDEAVATWAAQWFDIDDDGDLDLLVANDRFFFPGSAPVQDRVFVNQGGPGWSFVEDASAWGMDESHFGMGFAVGDLDGDLRFDIYTSDLGANELRLSRDSPPRPDRAPALGMELETGGTGKSQIGWGSAVCDFDGDGRMDLFAASGLLGTSEPVALVQEQALFLARSLDEGQLPVPPLVDRRFVRADDEAGLLAFRCQGARAAIPADFDGDGDLDLLLSTRLGPALLLRNDLPQKRPWYGVRLKGTRDTTEGLGSRLELRVGDTTVCDLVSSGGQPGGCLPPERILYPGSGAGADATLTVTWPDGTVQEVKPRRNRWTVVTQE